MRIIERVDWVHWVAMAAGFYCLSYAQGTIAYRALLVDAWRRTGCPRSYWRRRVPAVWVTWLLLAAGVWNVGSSVAALNWVWSAGTTMTALN